MAPTTAFCPFCRRQFKAASSSVRARTKRLKHIRRDHPGKEYADALLKVKGEDYKA